MEEFDEFMKDLEGLYADNKEVKEFTVIEKWDDGLPKIFYVVQKLSGMSERDMVGTFIKSP